MSKSPKNTIDEQKTQFENLSTGLKFYITEKLVKEIWEHDKPKMAFIDFLQDFVK